MAGSTQADVLIVGAGIAGLMAAQALSQQRARVLVVERKERVGGRMVTRRLGPGLADSGAQFFTARNATFQAYVERWLESGLVYEWSRGWSDGSLDTAPTTGSPRYAVRGGMQALAAALAASLNVRLGVSITSLFPTAFGWRAVDQNGESYDARAVILTLPIPTALALLDASQVTLADADRASLDYIDYAPCLSGLFWLNGDIRLPDPGAVQQLNATITWIADNCRKGISPDVVIVTVHAGPDYSRQYWAHPDSDALRAPATALQIFKDYRTEIVQARLDRWRYARPITIHPDRCLIAAGLPPLAFAGDAFGAPRIEGAALSGLAAGERLTW